MPLTANQVHTQVTGAIVGLDKLTAKERDATPSGTFADNYNKLLKLAKESMPKEEEARWPGECPIVTIAGRDRVSGLRYTEIHSFLTETLAILGEGVDYSL